MTFKGGQIVNSKDAKSACDQGFIVSSFPLSFEKGENVTKKRNAYVDKNGNHIHFDENDERDVNVVIEKMTGNVNATIGKMVNENFNDQLWQINYTEMVDCPVCNSETPHIEIGNECVVHCQTCNTKIQFMQNNAYNDEEKTRKAYNSWAKELLNKC